MSRLTLVLSVCAMWFSAPLSAEQIKVGCLTQQVWLKPGVPPVLVVMFDEQAGTASLFAREIGGLLHGDQVIIRDGLILFKVKTPEGFLGDVTIDRSLGTLMLNIPDDQAMKMLASCRRLTDRF